MRLYETGPDGHDFFPAVDFVRNHGRKPTRQEAEDFCREAIPLAFENRIEGATTAQTKATYSSMYAIYRRDKQYRARLIEEAADHIMNYEWDRLLETDD